MTADIFRLTWRWSLLDAPIPLTHQELEALADLADLLAREGYVLVGRPERRRTIHGKHPALVLDCRVREATDREAAALRRGPAA